MSRELKTAIHDTSFSEKWEVLLGHTKGESTVRYCGKDVDDAWKLAKQTEIQRRSLDQGS